MARLENIGRAEHLLKEIEKAERTEKELWNFIERLAMEMLMMRLEEELDSNCGDDGEAESRRDWGCDPIHGSSASSRRAQYTRRLLRVFLKFYRL